MRRDQGGTSTAPRTSMYPAMEYVLDATGTLALGSGQGKQMNCNLPSLVGCTMCSAEQWIWEGSVSVFGLGSVAAGVRPPYHFKAA